MKQVDFYLIKSSVKQARFKLASRLAGKLQKMEKSLLLVTSSETQTTELDECMWVYGDTSFVAHETLKNNEIESEENQLCDTHIIEHQLVNTSILDRNYDVLINLCDDVPLFSHHFSRIAEIVDADENSKAAGRSRFKHYKTEGFDLKMHDISL